MMVYENNRKANCGGGGGGDNITDDDNDNASTHPKKCVTFFGPLAIFFLNFSRQNIFKNFCSQRKLFNEYRSMVLIY